jgi:hypothetical protein
LPAEEEVALEMAMVALTTTATSVADVVLSTSECG